MVTNVLLSILVIAVCAIGAVLLLRPVRVEVHIDESEDEEEADLDLVARRDWLQQERDRLKDKQIYPRDTKNLTPPS